MERGRYRPLVQWWAAALWGVFGGSMVVGLDFTSVISRIGDWPWNTRKKMRVGPYFASVVVRLSLGGGLATAAAQSGYVGNALSAVTIGIATPLIVEKLTQAGHDLAVAGSDK